METTGRCTVPGDSRRRRDIVPLSFSNSRCPLRATVSAHAFCSVTQRATCVCISTISARSCSSTRLITSACAQDEVSGPGVRRAGWASLRETVCTIFLWRKLAAAAVTIFHRLHFWSIRHLVINPFIIRCSALYSVGSEPPSRCGHAAIEGRRWRTELALERDSPVQSRG